MISFPDKNTPRWIIFIFDIFISLFAVAVAYLLRFDFFISYSLSDEDFYILYTSLPIFVLVRIVTFYIGKTYAGIIRHTGMEDTKRIFKTVTTGTVIFIMFSFVRYQFIDGYYFLPRPIIAIDYLTTLVLMISSRVAIKLIYHEGKKDKANTKDIVIYGAGKMGVIVANTFSKSIHSKHNVVAFIDNDKSKAGKRLNGVKIYHPSMLDRILEKNNIDNLVIAILKPDVENENKVIDVCLAHNVIAMNVPPIEKWMDGELKLKQIKQVKIEDLLGRKEIELSKTKILDEVKDNVILVTGAAGSIGSEIVRQLLRFSPKEIVMLDQAETPLYDLEQELIEHRDIFSIVVGDISNKARMKNVFKHFKPQLVFHAAAYKHVPLMEDNPCEAILTNVQGTQNLVDLAEVYDIEKFVMISTDKAVNPTNVMGASKRLAEIITQNKAGKSKTKYITTRFGNVLGSNGSVIPLFKRQIEKGGPLTVTHEEVTRYFMTIPEACQLVLEAGTMGKGGEIFVFDMGKSVKIIDLARRMIKLSGFEPEKEIEIKITGLRPGEKLYEELLSDNETTIPTYHPQIMIGKVRETEEALFNTIDNVIEAANAQNNEKVVKGMKKIIPEFISNNSTFNSLDK